ncbi:hypothetical protein HDU96_010764 [Phlyctochytrium bullatum]|nr:hypothetical protein HDU96_010764 [Phlyctochytrium bullatum]
MSGPYKMSGRCEDPSRNAFIPTPPRQTRNQPTSNPDLATMRFTSLLSILAILASVTSITAAPSHQPKALSRRSPQGQQQPAGAVAKPNVDLDVLNFALTLEFLEAEFYRIGLTKFSSDDFRRAGFPRFIREQFQEISNHESVHVTFLTDVVETVFGRGKAVKKCEYNFDVALANVQNFVTFAAILERTGVSAYTGANKLLTNPDFLTAGASIATIEGRHSSFLNLLTGQLPAVGSFDTPLGIQPIVSIAAPLIKSCPFTLPPSPFPPLEVFAYRNRVRPNEAVMLSFAVNGRVPATRARDVNINVGIGGMNDISRAGAGLDAFRGLFCAWVFGLSQVRTPVLATEAALVNGQRVNVPACLVPNEIAQQQFTQVVLFAVNADVNVALENPRNVVAGPATVNL